MSSLPSHTSEGVKPERWLPLVGLLLVIWLVQIIRLDAPWYGVQDAPRTWIPAAVRNYDLIGTDVIGWMVVRNTGPAESYDDLEFYSHHPPLMVWMAAVTTRLFGYHELGIRYGFAATTFLAAAVFYTLVRRLYSARLAWWAVSFFALTPMVAYYGRVPGHDGPGLLFALAFALGLIDWLRQPTRTRWLLLALLAWLAAWTAWTAVFFLGTLGLAALVAGQRRHWTGIVALGGVTITACGVLIGFYQLQWAGTVDSLLGAFVWRTSTASGTLDTPSFTALEWLLITLAHAGMYFTPGLLLMGVLGVPFAWQRGNRKARSIFIGLFAGALTYHLFFRNASYVHDYYKYTFAPSLSIAAAAAWVYVRSDPRWRRFTRPVLDGLLLTIIGLSLAMLYGLHRTGSQPWLEPVIAAVTANSTEADTVLTHMDRKDQTMPLSFYTYRRIDYGISFAAAVEQAVAAPERVLYLWCPRFFEGEDIPVGTYRYPTITAGECTVVILRQ